MEMESRTLPSQAQHRRPPNASDTGEGRPEPQARPDVLLILNTEGIIRDATLANQFAHEDPETWIGHHWAETVSESDHERLRQMLEYACRHGVCAFHNVTQHFPSGFQTPVEYTTIHRDGHAGLLAIGKNLSVVAELESQLVEAQQVMERNYRKIREVETRYRLLFNSSRDAVLLLRASTLRIIDLNPAAAHTLGIALTEGKVATERRFSEALQAAERPVFDGLIQRLRERGKAPGVLLHFGRKHTPLVVRASLMTTAQEEVLLIQLTPAAAGPTVANASSPVQVEDLLEGGPDGFVVIDHEGIILHANRAFLTQTQMGSEVAVLGEHLGRWLGRPGADVSALLANVSRMGTIRLFSTVLHGELGAVAQMEVSAVGRGSKHGGIIGVFIRDIGRRLPAGDSGQGMNGLLESLTKQIGKTTLRKLVDDTVAVVEQRYIEAALDLTGGNRTAAAELLGLSRQSLYVKLARYMLEDDPHLLSAQHQVPAQIPTSQP
jgi:transcriptional regulator PpsR